MAGDSESGEYCDLTMKQQFSPHWKNSAQPRKQRKYRYNAPLHIKQKFLAAPLAEALQKKYGKKTAHVRKGDVVKVLRGQFRGQRGKVENVDLKRSRIFVEGAHVLKRDGAKASYPIHPSKVRVEELVLDDKKRRAKFEGTKP